MNKESATGGVKASQIQKQFWLLNQQANSAAYNIASAFYCVGLDEEKLVTATCDTVAAYTALNVEFYTESGELFQRKKNGLPWVKNTLQFCGEKDNALAILRQQAGIPFDYRNDALVRIVILRSDKPDTFYFLLVIPHIVIDLQTKRLLAREITSRYQQNNSARSDDNYQDYSDFLDTWRNGDEVKKYQAGWKQRLAEFTRKVSSIDGGHSGYSEANMDFSAELTHGLDRYCSANKTDVFIVLLAAYYWLLRRFSHSDNFAIGVPLSNRKQDQFKNTIGCFVNTVPIVPQTDDSDFLSMVRACRQALLHGHRFQDLPIIDIIASLAQSNKSNGESRALYNIGYTFEEPMELDLNEGICESILLPGSGPQLDLFLRLYNKNGTTYGRFEANTNFISEARLESFSASYIQLLHSLTITGQDSLPYYLPNADAERIAKFNQTEYDFALSNNTVLTSHFSKQVGETPESTALIDSTRSLSYLQFDQASNRLAQYLLAQGLSEGKVVAVYIERSIDMMIAIYGLLKAGMVYLPIDMDAPNERINFMLKQADAAAFLVVGNTDHRIDDRINVIDLRSRQIEHMDSLEPPTNTHIDSPAYIIFTSGSTGLPKGVLNNHRGILNRLCWGNKFFSIKPSDRILQKTPYSFDVSLWELFMPLQVGATLVLADHNSHKNPYEIARQIKQHAISIIHFVPSMLNAFLNNLDQRFTSLHTIFCSGEALSSDLQSRTFEHYPNIKLFNLYGPTEAAVEVSCWQCVDRTEETIPIGYPIDNVTLYIVDEELQQVPIGVMGELLIGGVQVAEGYINNTELSKDRFIENPFTQGRVYRTGDYARWLENGAVEYLGRKDSQVKINGIRVELGEIENAAAKHPAIDKVMVDYLEAELEKNVLVLYFTVMDSYSETIDVEEFQHYLAKSLPRYLIPQDIIQLDSFPINSSGKVDRKRLPKPSTSKNTVKSENTDSLCNNPIERTIYAIWRESLGNSNFGLDNAFFDVGGDSFSLLDVFDALKNEFPGKLTSVDVFRFTTIRSLAAYLEGEQKEMGKEGIDSRAEKMKKSISLRKSRGRTR